MAINNAKGKDQSPKETKQVFPKEQEHGKNLYMYVPSITQALVQALGHAHKEGMVHNDLHAWNIMLDFTIACIPYIGIIDWNLSMCKNM